MQINKPNSLESCLNTVQRMGKILFILLDMRISVLIQSRNYLEWWNFCLTWMIWLVQIWSEGLNSWLKWAKQSLLTVLKEVEVFSMLRTIVTHQNRRNLFKTQWQMQFISLATVRKKATQLVSSNLKILLII